MARPSRLCYTKDTIKIPEYYNKFIYSFFVFFFSFLIIIIINIKYETRLQVITITTRGLEHICVPKHRRKKTKKQQERSPLVQSFQHKPKTYHINIKQMNTESRNSSKQRKNERKGPQNSI